jgi:anthranilate synthase component 2
MNVLIIDNYDSFTYNLYQYAGEVLEKKGAPFVLKVFRNDKITLEQIINDAYNRIIISPGPGTPEEKKYFGVCFDVLKHLAPRVPLLGVCLGMQGMAYIDGGKITRAKVPMHGKVSKIKNDQQGVFQGLPSNLDVMRYHSLIVQRESLPNSFEISAETEDSEIMGIRHKEYPLEGIQFHPESFATEGGLHMVENFLFKPHLGYPKNDQ